MTETIVPGDKIQHLPHPIYLKDYQIPAYLIDEVHLHVDLFDDYALVTSQLTVRHNRLNASPLRDLFLNGEELTFESIRIDGGLVTASQYEVTSESLLIRQVPDNFNLEIITKIYPQKNTALSGLYRSSKTFCTQCEAEGFRRITYFPDHPDILSRYTTTITADATQYPYLLSNGNLVASGLAEGGRHWVTWEDPFKKPCYLFALVAGDFDLIEDTWVTTSKRDIALRIYVEKGYGEQANHAMYSLKEAMQWDEAVYGREYDLDIYMIVAISDFNMGAMENKGLNIFNTKYVLAKPETATDDDYIHILSVIGHEYFHNWSGNRVTCRDWFQLSLKEGLTIFRDQNFTEDLLSKGVMRIRDVTQLREYQFPEDAGPLAHPVRPDSYIEINNFYTATVYNKGAEVLRMLRTILGNTQFRTGMDLYFARYDGQAVTIEDYVQTMEDVSGINLSQFRLWYSQAGTPMLTIIGHNDANKKTYTLTMKQICPSTPGQPVKQPMHIPVRVGLLDQKGHAVPLLINSEQVESEKVLQFTEAEQQFVFKNVTMPVVPSLLRDFSAPVKLHYPYADDDLLLLLKHDTDDFNRWDAGQNYLLRVILNLLNELQEGNELILPHEVIEVYEYLLTSHQHDQLLLAEMLLVPSEKYIGEQMSVVDVDAIHEAREFLMAEVANELQSIFIKTYKENHIVAPYQFTVDDIGRRQLKNSCLAYLMRLPQYVEMGMQQFDASLTNNMTDSLAALIGLSNTDSLLRTKALDQFYATWQADALVMDKWFAIQAACKLPSTLAEVKQLMEHPAFDIKNPNKVYALIGTFGQRNPVCFHSKDGNGYSFLSDVVARLDKINPQVAARMVKPLTNFKRYDKERQKLMQEQLEWLLQSKKLSTDLYELVTKSLET